jgi:hypothetical protein
MQFNLPVEKGCSDAAGPDVTDWFAEDLVDQIKYRVGEQQRIAKKYPLPPAGFGGRDAGDAAAAGAATAAATADLFSFRYQAKYLMCPKWIDFGGPQEGRGVNTVVLADRCLRKNVLGNIELLVVGTVLPTSAGVDFTVHYPYFFPNGCTYFEDHPYADNFGPWKGKVRADNLAAFGVGNEIGERILKRLGLNPNSTMAARHAALMRLRPNVVRRIIEDVLKNEQVLTDAVNRYKDSFSELPKGASFTPDTLTFIPEFGGFNTNSCKPVKGNTYRGTQTSREYFKEHLEKPYNDYKARTYWITRDSFDTWLEKCCEDYTVGWQSSR